MKTINELINKVLIILPEITITKPAVKLVCCVIAIYAVLIILFILGVLYNANVVGKVELINIIEMVKVLLGPAAIAVIGFLGKAFIDSDRDGIPDAFEEQANNQLPEKGPGEGEKEC